MQIIKASLKHLNEVAVLFNSYREFYGQPTDLNGAKEFLEKRLANEDSVIFLVIEQENALGFVQLYPTFSSVKMKNMWILNDLYVTKSARGKGIGQILVEKAIEFAKETGATGLLLETGKENSNAQKLYEKTGFHQESNYFYYYSI
ncbi:GNAT family N-acetyltransferase [Sutcliffiella rhizosphaerae]|uniref:N-acetyltransferase domain-containing protein n=1 Tax=Sutcliffiella rhizosphaerae TaxID=2880967 RepID=A0ABN8A9Q8_9BACI|nr:GNAT family N-acetyltransferase [Sutcliffiella rhizosphaerae]CAG9621894.1 hypothetical protein BACCIP111883_02685 [Sutcliffiella rhizosphaerae]